MVGVFSLELLRMYSYLYQNTDKNYSIVHALDGYDEISLTGAAKVINNQSEQVLKASDFGVPELKQQDIYGGDSVASSAKIFTEVLNGKGSEAQNNVVCANAALAISTVKNTSVYDGFQMAKASLISGKAKHSFKTLVELSK